MWADFYVVLPNFKSFWFVDNKKCSINADEGRENPCAPIWWAHNDIVILSPRAWSLIKKEVERLITFAHLHLNIVQLGAREIIWEALSVRDLDIE